MGDKGLLWWLSSKEFACQCKRHRRCRFSPWVGKIPGGGNVNPLQNSCLENCIDRGVWWGYSPWGCRVRHDIASKTMIITMGHKNPCLNVILCLLQLSNIRWNIQGQHLWNFSDTQSWVGIMAQDVKMRFKPKVKKLSNYLACNNYSINIRCFL